MHTRANLVHIQVLAMVKVRRKRKFDKSDKQWALAERPASLSSLVDKKRRIDIFPIKYTRNL